MEQWHQSKNENLGVWKWVEHEDHEGSVKISRGDGDRNGISQESFCGKWDGGKRKCVSARGIVCMCPLNGRPRPQLYIWPQHHTLFPLFLSPGSNFRSIVPHFHEQINECLIFPQMQQSNRKLACLCQCLIWECLMFGSGADRETKPSVSVCVSHNCIKSNKGPYGIFLHST